MQNEKTITGKYCTLRISNENGTTTEVKIEAIVQGIHMTGHMSYQLNGRYPLRGTLYVKSPITLNTLTICKSQKSDAGPVSSKKVPASCEIRFSAVSAMTKEEMQKMQEQLIEYIDKSVQRLFVKYSEQILKEVKSSLTPQTLTPFFAWMLYGRKYMSLKHPGMGKKRYTHLIKSMDSMFFAFDSKPMIDYSARDILNFYKGQEYSKEQKALLYHFWDYCIAKGYCHCADNPVPAPEQKPLSPEALQRKATTPSVLSEDQMRRLVDILLSNASGADCGVALMLSGFSLDFVLSLKWSDIVFKDNATWAQVKYIRKELAGSVHDYTRPVIVEAYSVLKVRYDCLAKKYTEARILKMPVVSRIKNPEKPLPKAELKQHQKRRLEDIGITAFGPVANNKKPTIPESILIDTYKYRVGNCMGIGDDDGTMAFLRGEKMQSVTDQHYICYTSDEAQDRLYTILKRAALPKTIEHTVDYVVNPDGSIDLICQPDQTDRILSMMIKAELPKNAGPISIFSEHGVAVSDSVREVLPNGKKRRKSSKKS